MQKDRVTKEAQEHYSYGRVYLERGEPERAIEEFKASLEIDPDGVNSLIGMGQCLLSMQRVDEAITALERAVSLSSGFADAHYHLGLAYMDRNMTEKAINEFKEALNINPRYRAARSMMNTLLKTAESGAQARGADGAQRITEDEHISRQANIHFHMGNALFQKNLFKEALVEYKEAIRLRPNYPDIRNRLGELYLRRGQYGLAEEEFLTALKINPRYISALLNLAECYRLHSEMLLHKAEEEYHKVLQLDPKCSKASRGLEMIRSIKNIDFV